MAKLVAAGLILALAGPSLAESSSPDPVQAAPALWEWERAEFNAIVRVRPEDLKPLQQRLARTKDPGERRAISILLSLNCALPPQASTWRAMQAYRCGRMSFRSFRDWALSRQGDVYALAFSKSADRPLAQRSLQGLLEREMQKPVDDVEEKEFLAELIGYLNAGGLP